MRINITAAGGWTQTTVGVGPDAIAMSATLVIAGANGFKAPLNVLADLGVHNDHSGPGLQEWPFVPICAVNLAPDERAELIVSYFGKSQGGFFQQLVDSLPDAITTALTALGAVGISTVAGAVTESIIGAARDNAGQYTYAGSIRAWFTGSGNWDMLPAAQAALHFPMNDPGDSKHATYSFVLNAGGRPEYFPKLKIVIEPDSLTDAPVNPPGVRLFQ